MSVDPSPIKQRAAELQFALCGVCEARPSDYAQELRDWLEAGKHGTMDWLARNVEKRIDPRELMPGCRSVICVADWIGPGGNGEGRNSNDETDEPDGEESDLAKPPAGAHKSSIINHQSSIRSGRIARYAQVDDYHKIIKKRLHRMADELAERWPEHRFRACVDTAPVLEREHAMRAGLGWVGKNTLVLNDRLGSHLLLGELLTTLPLVPDEPATDHCGRCTRCIDACPTDCITPYSVDASRCISYLTIENRGPIAPEFDGAIGDWLFGCDICQQVCPFNDPQRGSATRPEQYGRRPASMDVLEVLGWSEADRRAAFTRSAMKRAKLHQMKRNALLVARNALRKGEDPELRGRVERIAADPEEPDLVRETAARVLQQA